MNTNTQEKNSVNIMMWVAGIAVIMFSILGISAIMGWVPTTMGRGQDSSELAGSTKQATNAATPSGAKASATKTPASQRPSPAPARVAQAPVAAAPVAPASAPAREICNDCGVIESTREVSSKGTGSGIGAVGGAIVGGLLGNQVGSGRGNTAATAIGAVGGAVAGNEVERRTKTSTSYEVTVRMNDGTRKTISQASTPSWRSGDNVRIVDGSIRANP